jgi:hypothetical protein
MMWSGSAGAEPPAAPSAPPPRTDAATAAVPATATTAVPTTDQEEEERFARELERAPPPPSHVVYFQYGVAFTGNQVLSPGAICADASKPCVLGSGGGIVIRGGWRSSGPLYLGAAYELTKQDPDKLYRIALLQQARAEVRYYVPTHRVVEPYFSGSLGVIGYGNEWAVDTFGPSGSLGGGLEYQITQSTVVGLGLGYRLAYFTKFVDTAGDARDAGVAQMLGLDILLEQRAAILRTDATK